MPDRLDIVSDERVKALGDIKRDKVRVAKLKRTILYQGSNFGKILYGSEHTRDLAAKGT
jgi:hypothetical protein